MKTKLPLSIAIIIGLKTFNALAVSIAVPSKGTCVREADTIINGIFTVDKGNVNLHITSTIKGQHTSQQRVHVVKLSEDMFFDLVYFVSELQGKECVVLGAQRDDGIELTWSTASVWPYGLINPNPMFESVESCTRFISAILEYEKLDQSDEQALAKHLIQDIQNEQQCPFALAYLNSYRDTKTRQRAFEKNKDLRNDVLRVVASHLVMHHVDDEWTVECMLRLSPGMPQSMMIPYFQKIASFEGRRGNEALGQLCSIIGIPRMDTDPDTGRPRKIELPSLDTINARAREELHGLQQHDAKNSIHLFDNPNEAIADSASLVFSTIFDTPAPRNLTRAEEKEFWKTKIIDEKEVRRARRLKEAMEKHDLEVKPGYMSSGEAISLAQTVVEKRAHLRDKVKDVTPDALCVDGAYRVAYPLTLPPPGSGEAVRILRVDIDAVTGKVLNVSTKPMDYDMRHF